eukprot:TRINITY_DN2251_c0_g1_i1.p1 TRINITY_DN2251_c0_g1~~TRINITY_DN2251_c0_g1_i1.p1  ORF type:complete len:1643 (+),score=218.95 TRINITY_DN2251_c0_g1_i1:128-5056(+)
METEDEGADSQTLLAGDWVAWTTSSSQKCRVHRRIVALLVLLGVAVAAWHSVGTDDEMLQRGGKWQKYLSQANADVPAVGASSLTYGMRPYVCGGKFDQVSCEYKWGNRPWSRYVKPADFSSSRRRGAWRCDYWVEGHQQNYSQRVVINGVVVHEFTESGALALGLPDCRYDPRDGCQDTASSDVCSYFTSAYRCDNSGGEAEKTGCCVCGGGEPAKPNSVTAPLAEAVVGTSRRRWPSNPPDKYVAPKQAAKLQTYETTPLSVCSGDCDADTDCDGNSFCYQRSGSERVPGCSGEGRDGWDYCVDDQNAVLFLGGSQTVKITRMVTEVFGSSTAPLNIRRIASSGDNLTMHWRQAEKQTVAYSSLQHHSWKYIILEEDVKITAECCSTNPIFAQYQGIYQDSTKSIKEWAERIKTLGSKPIIFQPLAQKSGRTTSRFDMDYVDMEDAIVAGLEHYIAVLEAAGHKPLVAPVGKAFRLLYQKIKGRGQDPHAASSLWSKLYDESGKGPSEYGQYLAACVLFGTITGQSPLYLPDPISSGYYSPGTEPSDSSISADDAIALREIAYEALHGSCCPATSTETTSTLTTTTTTVPMQIGAYASSSLGITPYVCGGAFDKVSCEYKKSGMPWAGYVKPAMFSPSRRRGVWKCDYWVSAADDEQVYTQRAVINGVTFDFSIADALAHGKPDCRHVPRLNCLDTASAEVCSDYTSAYKCDQSASGEAQIIGCCSCGGGQPTTHSEPAPRAKSVPGTSRRRWRSSPLDRYIEIGQTADLQKGDSAPLGHCSGECDADTDCHDQLLCYQRNGSEHIPGCSGKGVDRWDYCVRDPNAALFIGNSYTYMITPTLEETLSISPAPFTVRSITFGGTNLSWQLENKKDGHEKYKLLTAANWKYVVFQEAAHIAMRGAEFNPITRDPSGIFDDSKQAVEVWAKIIKDLGHQPTPVIYQPWGRRTGSETLNSQLLNFTYVEQSHAIQAGTEYYVHLFETAGLKPLVAPVGKAFLLLHDKIQSEGKNPNEPSMLWYKLFDEDQSHPGEHGAYLTAAVFFGTLTGQSPLYLPDPITAGFVRSDDWQNIQGDTVAQSSTSTVASSSITAEEARILREIAHEVLHGSCCPGTSTATTTTFTTTSTTVPLVVGASSYDYGTKAFVCGGRFDNVSCEYKWGDRPWARYTNAAKFYATRRRGVWRCDYWVKGYAKGYSHRAVLNGVAHAFKMAGALAHGQPDCRHVTRAQCQDTASADVCSEYESAYACDNSAGEAQKSGCCSCGGGKPVTHHSTPAPLPQAVVGTSRRRWRSSPTSKYISAVTTTDLHDSSSPLAECSGDCDDDSDCQGKLLCFSRKYYEPVPTCSGMGRKGRDYCVSDPNSILFVGSSFTMRIMRMTTEVFNASSAPLTIRKLASHGDTLTMHWQRVAQSTEAYCQLLGRSFRYIILEEYANIIAQAAASNPIFADYRGLYAQSTNSVQKWGERIVSLGAIPVVYQPPGRRVGWKTTLYDWDYIQMNAAIEAGVEHYISVLEAAGHKPLVAPVGKAFLSVYKRHKAEGKDPYETSSLWYRLYTDDGNMPSEYGQYLATCVFFGTITGKSPVYLPNPISSGYSSLESTISTTDALTLRNVANGVVFRRRRRRRRRTHRRRRRRRRTTTSQAP